MYNVANTCRRQTLLFQQVSHAIQNCGRRIGIGRQQFFYPYLTAMRVEGDNISESAADIDRQQDMRRSHVPCVLSMERNRSPVIIVIAPKPVKQGDIQL